MKKIIVFLLVLFALSCDDGNVDIPGFDFTGIDIDECGDITLFKIDDNEVLVIDIEYTPEDGDTFLTHDFNTGDQYSLTENGTHKIAYRTLESKPSSNYFCQNIPPTSPAITNEWLGTGTLFVVTTVTEDDEDGVPAADEMGGNDPNGDADGDQIRNSLDTTDDGGDGDGSVTDYTDDDGNGIPDVYEHEDYDEDGDDIPNYLDHDDDGDTVLTKDENPDPNGDGDVSDAQDTDGDGTPDYLDEDDDGDGINTNQELTSSDSDLDGIEDYLDFDTDDPKDKKQQVKNRHKINYAHVFTITPLALFNSNGNTIRFDTFNYGTKNEPVPVETEIPEIP